MSDSLSSINSAHTPPPANINILSPMHTHTCAERNSSERARTAAVDTTPPPHACIVVNVDVDVDVDALVIAVVGVVNSVPLARAERTSSA